MRNFVLFAIASCSLSFNAMAQNQSAQEVNAKTADKVVEAISSKNANLLSEMIIYYTDRHDYKGHSVIDAEKAMSLISSCTVEGRRGPIGNDSMSLDLSCKGRLAVNSCTTGNLVIIITYETLNIGEVNKDTEDCLLRVPPSTRRTN